MHALELKDAFDRGNLETARRHAEHLGNLIEGRAGSSYGDLDRDGATEDPGDGTGMLTYLVDVAGAASGDEFLELLREVRTDVEQVRTHALFVIAAQDVAPAEKLGADALALARASSRGIGTIDTKAQEAGIQARPLARPDVPGVVEETDAVTVVADQFQFIAPTMTIEKGSTVVWVNKEAPKHTAAADDGRFNSGGLSQGDTFSFTFEESGAFSYYCRFHGDKGGVGMAGTIVVNTKAVDACRRSHTRRCGKPGIRPRSSSDYPERGLPGRVKRRCTSPRPHSPLERSPPGRAPWKSHMG